MHGLIAWIIAVLVLAETRDRRLAMVCGAFSDIDGIFYIWDRALYSQYHHTFGHSYVVALPLIMVATYLAVDRKRTFAASLAAFTAHLGADIIGSNWPVQLLYPLTTYQVPQEQLLSTNFIYLTLLPATFWAVMAIVALVTFLKGASPFEFVSKRLDQLVIGALVFPFKYHCDRCRKRALMLCQTCGARICPDHVADATGGFLTIICSECDPDHGPSERQERTMTEPGGS